MIREQIQNRKLRDFCTTGQTKERLVIGITGNPGAGKSTVAEIMKDYGAIVFDADALGYEMLEKDSPVFANLIDLFGQSILNSRGEIEREALGRIVFSDPEQLNRLNAIVHPLMLARIKEAIDQFRESRKSGPLVIDAALIFEWDIARWFDGVLVVAAPKMVRFERYLSSKGGEPDILEQKENSQLSEIYKIEHADAVISNDGDLAALHKRIRNFMN